MPLDGSNEAEREASEKIWKFQNFSNFAPKMGKKVQLQQKKFYKIFLYILCHYLLILAFKFFETREKMPADHDLDSTSG